MTGKRQGHKTATLYALNEQIKVIRARVSEADRLPRETPRQRSESTRRRRLAQTLLDSLKAAREDLIGESALRDQNAKTRVLLEDLVRLYSAAEKAQPIRRQVALEALAKVVSEARLHLQEGP